MTFPIQPEGSRWGWRGDGLRFPLNRCKQDLSKRRASVRKSKKVVSLFQMLKRQVKTLTSIPNSEKHPSVRGQILEESALEDIRRRKRRKQILAGAHGKEWLHAASREQSEGKSRQQMDRVSF